MAIHWLEASALQERVAAAVRPASVVLDIGCGACPQAIIKPQLHICCEPHSEYVTFLQHVYGQTSDYLIVQADGVGFLRLMPNRSVDTVFLLDVIEHLPRDEGHTLLQECERVARQQIVLFTPLGFLSQEYGEGDEDAWGFHGGRWQRHLSGWCPDDFDSSWMILACRHYHAINGKGERFVPPAGAFWAIKTLEILSVPVSPPDGKCRTDADVRRLQGELASALLQIQKQQNQLVEQQNQLVGQQSELARNERLLTEQLKEVAHLKEVIEGMRASVAWRSAEFMSRVFHGLLSHVSRQQRF
jgi:hypothetical protein